MCMHQNIYTRTQVVHTCTHEYVNMHTYSTHNAHTMHTIHTPYTHTHTLHESTQEHKIKNKYQGLKLSSKPEAGGMTPHDCNSTGTSGVCRWSKLHVLLACSGLAASA